MLKLCKFSYKKHQPTIRAVHTEKFGQLRKNTISSRPKKIRAAETAPWKQELQNQISGTLFWHHIRATYSDTIRAPYSVRAPYSGTIFGHHIRAPFSRTINRHHTRAPYSGTIYGHHTRAPYSDNKNKKEKDAKKKRKSMFSGTSFRPITWPARYFIIYLLYIHPKSIFYDHISLYFFYFFLS